MHLTAERSCVERRYLEEQLMSDVLFEEGFQPKRMRRKGGSVGGGLACSPNPVAGDASAELPLSLSRGP